MIRAWQQTARTHPRYCGKDADVDLANLLLRALALDRVPLTHRLLGGAHRARNVTYHVTKIAAVFTK